MEAEGRARAERTLNMYAMSVTLDVSKLSGWLNADTYCRESKGGYTVRCEVRVGGWEVAGDRRVRSAQGRARLQILGAHPEHVAHCCDAGRVEAQWLVEHRRGLPRVKSRACVAGRGAGRGAGGGGRPRGASSAHGRARRHRLGAGHGEERTPNMNRMFVTLEVSKLT